MARGDRTVGRRVGSVGELERGGDYCLVPGRPDSEIEGERVDAVWFLLPMARDDGVEPTLRSVRRITSPPWTFRECDDGSVEVRASIGVVREPQDADRGRFLWHGFLDEGHFWREV